MKETSMKWLTNQMAGALTPRAFLGISLIVLTAVSAPGALAATKSEVVDIQFSLCDTPAKIVRALHLRPKGSEFKVWLFDDAALGLFAKGLRLRLRETKQGAELTLKATDQDCSNPLPGTMLAGEGKCEYDLHGSKIAGALSLTRTIDARTTKNLAAGRQSLSSELSAAQKNFLRGMPGAWPLPSDLLALGPTRVLSYRTKNKPYAVDISTLPGEERFIEISRKVPKADSASAYDQFEADLIKAGVTVCEDQSAQAINKLRALLSRP